MRYASAIRSANSRRASAKIDAPRVPCARPAPQRRAAPPGRPAPAPAAATACISSSLPLQCSTTSQPAASDARLRSPIEPLNAPMDTSSPIKSPSKPMKPRITSRIIVADVVTGSTGSKAVKTTWAVIPSGSPFNGRKAAKSVASSSARAASHHRQLLMAVRGGAAMAGDVLEHRQHATVQQALAQLRLRWPRPGRGSRHRRGRR